MPINSKRKVQNRVTGRALDRSMGINSLFVHKTVNIYWDIYEQDIYWAPPMCQALFQTLGHNKAYKPNEPNKESKMSGKVRYLEESLAHQMYYRSVCYIHLSKPNVFLRSHYLNSQQNLLTSLSSLDCLIQCFLDVSASGHSFLVSFPKVQSQSISLLRKLILSQSIALITIQKGFQNLYLQLRPFICAPDLYIQLPIMSILEYFIHILEPKTELTIFLKNWFILFQRLVPASNQYSNQKTGHYR